MGPIPLPEPMTDHRRPDPAGSDRDALEAAIADRFWDRVRLLAACFLRDRAAAEDVAQETIRRVIEAIRGDRIENREAIAGFVLQTARNICLHQSRSNRRRNVAMTRIVAGYAVSTASEPDPLHDLLSEERRSLLEGAIGRLEASDRELLRLFFTEGLSAEEVGLRLGLTPAAARVRKHRALQRVQEELRGWPKAG